MKKYILGYLIFIALAFISAANTINSARPATPKIVRHQMFNLATSANDYVGECIRDGYIIKSVTSITQWGSGSSMKILVIAEKY